MTYLVAGFMAKGGTGRVKTVEGDIKGGCVRREIMFAGCDGNHDGEPHNRRFMMPWELGKFRQYNMWLRQNGTIPRTW